MHTSLFIASRARWISTIAGLVVLISSAPFPVSAQKISYTDVPVGAYYEDAAAALLNVGALDASETRLRPSDRATRAELVKLLVNLNTKRLLYPTRSSFNDVSLTAWYSPYFEAAASAGWVRGDGDCYQQFRPCTARPPNSVNRAEAAALLERAFALEHTGTAPQFPDNSQNQWYYLPIQTAGDHCVLQGDGATGMVRPSAYMNRAEMVVMFNRAYENLLYGRDCGVRKPRISATNALTSSRVRVTFDTDLDSARARDASRYSVLRPGGVGNISVQSATLINNRTVDLDLNNDLASRVTYQLSVQNMLTSRGVMFSDNATFTALSPVGL